MTKEQGKTLNLIAATILLIVAANLAMTLYDYVQSSPPPAQSSPAHGEYIVVRHISSLADLDDSWGTRAIQSVINDHVAQGWEFVQMQGDGIGAILVFRR